MKKFNLIRKTLVTLMAIVLSVTFTCSDYTTVNADTTSTEVSSEKELVQCSNDWTIFKYTDESGNPQFDVKYQNKTVEELEAEETILKYEIILKGSQHESYSSSIYNFTGTIEIDSFYLEYPNDIFVRFMLYQDYNMVYSDAIPIYMDYDASPYILSGNPNYLEVYDLMSNSINNFTVTLKISEHLKQIGDLSISKKVPNFNIDTETINTSNLAFENHSDTYTIDEKTYTINYSTVTFDLEVPSKYFYNFVDKEITKRIISYIFSFNGLVSLNSENNIENYQLEVRTPAFPNVDIPVESITINGSSSVKVGESITLTASILPTDATNKGIIWSSSNDNCATVDENGIVTAKAAGTVTITATSTDGSEVEGTYTLTVEEPTTTEPPTTEPPTTKPKNVLVNSIKITSSSSSVSAGNTIDLNASINSDATNKSIAWSSSNTKYATVDANGLVRTTKSGAGKSVVITVKALDGSGKTATFTLKISKVKVKKLKIKVSKKSVKVGKKLKFKVVVKPTNATNKKVKWSVSNKKYAKINSKGVLTAKKAGAGKTVKVTVKAKDGSGKKATIKIKIKK